MKYFVLVLVTFIVAGSHSTYCVYAQRSNPIALKRYGYSPPVPIDIGTHLSGVANDAISSIVHYVANLVLMLIPPNTPVFVATLSDAIVLAQHLTLGTLLETVCELVNFDVSPLISALPRFLTALPLDKNNLANCVLGSIFPNTQAISFASLVRLLAYFLQGSLFESFVGLLNVISNHSFSLHIFAIVRSLLTQ